MLDDRVVARIGEYLHAYRKSKRMSLRDLSDKCGVSRSTISRYEAGMDGDIDKYDRICKALGVDFKEVVTQAQNSVILEVMEDMKLLDERRLELNAEQMRLKQQEERLLELFRDVNDQSRSAVIGILEAMPKESG